MAEAKDLKIDLNDDFDERNKRAVLVLHQFASDIVKGAKENLSPSAAKNVIRLVASVLDRKPYDEVKDVDIFLVSLLGSDEEE